MYAIYAQIYWPVWLISREAGHSYVGMLGGAVAVVLVWSLAWWLEFKTWKFWA